MKSVILAVPLLFVASFAFAGKDIVITTTETNPALFLGLSWTFAPGASSEGGSSGVTLKILSTNERNAGAFTAGVPTTLTARSAVIWAWHTTAARARA